MENVQVGSFYSGKSEQRKSKVSTQLLLTGQPLVIRVDADHVDQSSPSSKAHHHYLLLRVVCVCAQKIGSV